MTRFLPALLSFAVLGLTAACGGPSESAARGEAIFDTCAPCHGDLGEGNEILAAPAIAGAPEWYVRGQIAKFQGGQRGYHHTDAAGLRMRPMSRTLTSEEDVDAIVAYLATLPTADPPAVRSGDPDAGETEYEVCAACHGPNGQGQEALSAPSLLHLSDWYIVSSVQKYRDRVRGATPGDPTGITMYPMVAPLSDERIENVAAYIMTLRPRPTPAPGTTTAAQPGDAAPLDVDPAILPEGVTVEMAQEGLSIFTGAGICYTCHVAGGVGGPLAPDLTDATWLHIDGEYESIVNLIMTGVPQPLEHPGAMLPRAGMPLTDDQVRAVAAYVYTLSR